MESNATEELNYFEHYIQKTFFVVVVIKKTMSNVCGGFKFFFYRDVELFVN